MSNTLVATPDPPDEVPGLIGLEVEVLLDSDDSDLATPVEIIDCWLDMTRHRDIFSSEDVMNVLLDIRNSLVGAST